MRTPEEQERFLEHDRFRESPGGIPRWARIGCAALLGAPVAIVVIALSLNFLGRHFTKQIAADQRTRYGYSVETYRWNNEGFRIRIWGEDRFRDIRLDFPTLVLVKLHRRSWLAGDRAILLEMDTEHKGDSARVTSEMLVFYDFRKGDLRACGVETLPQDQTDSCRDLRAFAASLQ